MFFVSNNLLKPISFPAKILSLTNHLYYLNESKKYRPLLLDELFLVFYKYYLSNNSKIVIFIHRTKKLCRIQLIFVNKVTAVLRSLNSHL